MARERPPPLPVFSNTNAGQLSFNSAEALQFFEHTCSTLQNHYIEFANQLNSETRARMDMLARMRRAQEQDLQKLQQRVRATGQNEELLRRNLARVQTFQEALGARVELLLELLLSHRDSLSDAEVEYHAELRQRQAEQRALADRVHSLKLQVSQLASNNAAALQANAAPRLSAQHAQRVRPLIDEQSRMIAALTEQARALGASGGGDLPG